MEDYMMNGWLSFPNLAIRRFCPARVEQEQERGGWEETLRDEFDEFFYDPFLDDQHNIPTSPPALPASELDEMVNSFINVDDHIQVFDHHHPYNDTVTDSPMNQPDDNEMEMFSVVTVATDDVFSDLPMMLEGDDDQVDDMSSSVPDMVLPCVEEVSTTTTITTTTCQGVDQGLHLVHLLLACAEAVGCRDTQLAHSMLSQIWASVNPWGDSLQRVSYCFAEGLKSRLLLLNNVNANGTFSNCYGGHAMDVSLTTREERMEAFQLLHRTTPYIAFGYMVSNEVICQASTTDSSLHIIDLVMEHTLQWPSLIRTLSSRPEGPPKLRITGLIDDCNFLQLESSMKALVEDACSLGICLEFNLITKPVTPSLLTKENLGLREGEALFVNSAMQLHKFVKESRGSLKAILQAIKKLNPTLVTVVEQDANHNGPFFLGRFLESLHYYSAIFDSLEASLPRNSLQRMKIEKLHFAEEIRNIVACEGTDRIERHERADQWRRQLGRAGFQITGMKCLSQARMLLSIYGCDGYTLNSEKGCLLLGWKGRPVMLASAWQINNASS